MEYVLQLLPIFIIMAESLMGGGTGPEKKNWVVNQIERIISTLILTEAQKSETWAQVMAILTMEFPEPIAPPVSEEPKKQSLLGRLIDLLAGLFA